MDLSLEERMAKREPNPMDKPHQRLLAKRTLSSLGQHGPSAKPIGLVALALVVGLAGCADPNAWKRTACEQASAQLGQATVQQIELLRKSLGLAAEVDPVAYCRSIGAAMGSAVPTPAEGQTPSSAPNGKPTTSPTGRPLSAAEQAPGR
jgi:hypothetical protein